jgi:hypothetical protein
MAGWLTVLKLVPWADVISNAPKVAAGARKLWDAAARKPAPAEAAAGMAKEPPADPTVALAARLDQTDAALADLRGKLLTATELIATLADQNEQLIAKIDAMRVRMLWLSVASGAALLVAIVAFAATRT